MSNIRVTYTGLFSFLFGIISILTGLVFTVIVTRSLSPTEFGSWGVIGTLVSYTLIMGSIVNYWSTREISRGEESGKTAILFSSSFSIFAIAVYFLIQFFFTEQIDPLLLVFGVILVPIEFIKLELTALTHGYKPQNIEFSLIIFEISKIILALVLVYYFEYGVFGAITATAIGSLASSIFLFFKAKPILSGKLQKNYIKKWLKLSWIPLFPKISGILTNLDVAVFTLITGSPIGIAYWAASKSIGGFISHSSKINKALYPKLLGNGKEEIFNSNLTHVLYFAIPSMGIVLVFAKPALFILNPEYVIAIDILFFIAPLFFITLLSYVFSQFLFGTEKIDLDKNSGFRDYVKSNLVTIPFANLIRKSIYLFSLIIILFSFKDTATQIELVTYWVILGIITEIPFTIYLGLKIHFNHHLKFNFIPILKYALISLVVCLITYFVLENSLVFHESIFDFIPVLLPYFVLTVSLYLIFTYIVDKNTQKLIKSIIKEFKK